MSITVVTGKKITNEPVVVYKNRRTNFNSNIHSFDFNQNDLNTDRVTYNSSYDDDDEDLYSPTSNRIITVYHSNNIQPRDNRLYDNQIKATPRRNDQINVPTRKNDQIRGPSRNNEYGAVTKQIHPKQNVNLKANESTLITEKRGRTISPTRNDLEELSKKPPHDKRKAHLNNVAASKLKSEKLKALADKEDGERRREYVQQMDNIRRKQAHDKAVALASLQEISPLQFIIDNASNNAGEIVSSSTTATLSRRSGSSNTNNGVYHSYYPPPKSNGQLSINSSPPPPPPPSQLKHPSMTTDSHSTSYSQSISLTAKQPHGLSNKPTDTHRGMKEDPAAIAPRLSIPDLPQQFIASEKQQQQKQQQHQQKKQQRGPKPSQAEPDTGVIIKPRPKKKTVESGSDLEESFEEDHPEFPPSRRGAANPPEDSDDYSDDYDDGDGNLTESRKTSQEKGDKVELDHVLAKKILMASKRKKKTETLKVKQQSERDKKDKETKLKALSTKCRKLAPPPTLPTQTSQGEEQAQPQQHFASESAPRSPVPLQVQDGGGRIEGGNTDTIDTNKEKESDKKFDTANTPGGISGRLQSESNGTADNTAAKSKNSSSHKRTEKFTVLSSEEKKKKILADQRKARDEEMKKAKKELEDKKLLREQQLKLLNEKSQKVATIPIRDLLKKEEEEREKLKLENKNNKKRTKRRKGKSFLPVPMKRIEDMEREYRDMESRNSNITTKVRSTRNTDTSFVPPSVGKVTNQEDTSCSSSSDRRRYDYFDSDDINEPDGESREEGGLAGVQAEWGLAGVQKPQDFDHQAIGRINTMISTFAGVRRPSPHRGPHDELGDDGSGGGTGDTLLYPTGHQTSSGRHASPGSTRYSGNRYEYDYEYTSSQGDHGATSSQSPSASGGVNTSHPRLNGVSASRRVSPYDSIPYAVATHMSSSHPKPHPALTTVSAPVQPSTFKRPLTAEARMYQTHSSHQLATAQPRRREAEDGVEEMRMRYGRHHERRDTSSSRSRSRSRSKTPTIVKRVTRSAGNPLSHADAETPFRMDRNSDRPRHDPAPARLADNKRPQPSFPTSSSQSRSAAKSAIVDKYQRFGMESSVTANDRGRSKQPPRTSKNYASQSSSRSRSGSRSRDGSKVRKRPKEKGGLGSTVVYTMRQGEREVERDAGERPASLGRSHATWASKKTTRGGGGVLPKEKGGYSTKNLFADDITNLIYEDSQSDDGDDVLFADNDSDDLHQKENKPYDRNNNRNTTAISDKYNKLQAIDKARTGNKVIPTQLGPSEPEDRDRVAVIDSDRRKGFNAADGSIDIVMFTRVLGEVERIQAMLSQINKDIELTVAEQVRESVVVLPKDPAPLDGRGSAASTYSSRRTDRNALGFPGAASYDSGVVQEEDGDDGDVPETISGKSQSGSSCYSSGSQSDGSLNSEAHGRPTFLPKAADLNRYLNVAGDEGVAAPAARGDRKYPSAAAGPQETYLLVERQRYSSVEGYEVNGSYDDQDADRQYDDDDDVPQYGWENNGNLHGYDNDMDANNEGEEEEERGQDADSANRSYHSEDDSESLQVQRTEFRKSIDNVLMQSVGYDSHSADYDVTVANGLPTLRSGVSLLLPRNPNSKLSDDPYLNFSLGILQDQRDVLDRYASDDAMRAILASQSSSREARQTHPFPLAAPGRDTSPPLQPAPTLLKSTGQTTSHPKNFTAVALSDEPEEEKAYLPSLRNVGELGSVFNMPSYKYPMQGRSAEEENLSWSSADSSDHGLSIVSIVANEILRKQERDAANQYERERDEILKASARNALKSIEDETLQHYQDDFAAHNDEGEEEEDALGVTGRGRSGRESPREADMISEQQFWENVQRVPVQKRAVLIQQWYDEKDRNAHRNRNTSSPAVALPQEDTGIEQDDASLVGDARRSRSTIAELEPLQSASAGRARYNPSDISASMAADSDLPPYNSNRYSQHIGTGFGTREAATTGVAASDAKEPRRLSPADLRIQMTDQLRRQDDIFKYSLELSELEQANTIQSASQLVQSAITQVEREAFEARRIQELSLQRQSYEIGLKSAMAAADAVIREEALAREVVVAELKNTVAQQQIHGQYAQYMAQAAQVADNLHSTSLLLEIEQRMPNLSQTSSQPVSDPAPDGKDMAAMKVTGAAAGGRKEMNLSAPTSPNEKQKRAVVPSLPPLPPSGRPQKHQHEEEEGDEEEDYSESFEQESRLGRNLSQSYLSVPKSSARTTHWEKSNNDYSISEDISHRDFAVAAASASLSQSRKSRGSTDHVDESRYTEDFDEEEEEADEVVEEEEEADSAGQVEEDEIPDENYESVSSSLTTSPRSMQGTSRKDKPSKPQPLNPPRSFKELEPIEEHSRSRSMSLSEDLDGVSDSFQRSNRNSPKRSGLGATGLAASLESSLKLKFGKIDKNSSLALTKLINDDSTSYDVSPRGGKSNAGKDTLTADSAAASDMLAEYRAEMESRMRSQEKSLKIRLQLLKSKRKEQMSWVLSQRESLEAAKRSAKAKAKGSEAQDIAKRLQHLSEEERRFMAEFEEARAELERERWTVNAKAYKELRSFSRLKKDMEQYEHNLVAKHTRSKSLPDATAAAAITKTVNTSSRATSRQIVEDSNISNDSYSSGSFIEEDEEEVEEEEEESIRTEDPLKRRIGGGQSNRKSRDEVDDEISEAVEESYTSDTIRTVEETAGNHDYSEEFEVEESMLASSVASKSYSGVSFRSTVEKPGLRNDALKKKSAGGTSSHDDKSAIVQEALRKSAPSIDVDSLAHREAAVKRRKQEAEALIRQKKEEIELRKRQLALEEEERAVNLLLEEALAIDVDQQIEEDRRAIRMKAKKDVEEAAGKLAGLSTKNKPVVNLSSKDKSQPKPTVSVPSQSNNKIASGHMSTSLSLKAKAKAKEKQPTKETSYDDDDFDEVEEEVPEEEEEEEEEEDVVEESFEEMQESEPEVSDEVVEEEEENSYVSSHNVSDEVDEDMDDISRSQSSRNYNNNNASSQSIVESIDDRATNNGDDEDDDDDVEESYSTYATESVSASRPASRTGHHSHRSEKGLAKEPVKSSSLLEASASHATQSYDLSYEEESRLVSTSSRNDKAISTKPKSSKSNVANKSVEFSVTYADDFDISTIDKIPPKEHQKNSQNTKSGITTLPQKMPSRDSVGVVVDAEVSVGSGSGSSGEGMERSDDTLRELESSYDRHRLHIEELKAKLKQSQKEKMHLEKLKIKKSERDQLLREETELLQQLQEEQEALFKEKAELHRALGKGVTPTTDAATTATATQSTDKSTVMQRVSDSLQPVLPYNESSSSLSLQEKLLEVDMRSATVGRQWFQTLTEPLADEQAILEKEAELDEDSWASDEGDVVAGKGKGKGGGTGKTDVLSLLTDRETMLRSTIRKQHATVMIQSMFRKKLACIKLNEMKRHRANAKHDLVNRIVQGDIVEDLEVVAIRRQELLEDSFASTADSEEDRVDRELSELAAQDLVVTEQLQEVESKRSNLAIELAAREAVRVGSPAGSDGDGDGDISVGEVEEEEEGDEASTEGRDLNYEREAIESNAGDANTSMTREEEDSYNLQVDASSVVYSDADAEGDSSFVESASSLLSPISNDSPLRPASASASTPPAGFKTKRLLTVVVDDDDNNSNKEDEEEVEVSSGSGVATVAWSSSKLGPEATPVVPAPVPAPIVENDSEDIEEVLEEEEVIEEEEEEIEKEKDEEEEEYQLDDYEEEFESDSQPSSSPTHSKTPETHSETAAYATPPMTVGSNVTATATAPDEGMRDHTARDRDIEEDSEVVEEDFVDEELDEYEDYESDHEESQLELIPAVEQDIEKESDKSGLLESPHQMDTQHLEGVQADDYEELFEVSEEAVTSFRGLVSSDYDLVETVKKPVRGGTSPTKESSGHKVEFSPLPDEIFEISEEEVEEEEVEEEEEPTEEEEDELEESFNKGPEIDIERQTDFVTAEIWKRMCMELQHDLPDNGTGTGDKLVPEIQFTSTSSSTKTRHADVDQAPVTVTVTATADNSSLSSLSDIPPVTNLLPKSTSSSASAAPIDNNDLDDLYADFDIPTPVIAMPGVNKKKVESGYGGRSTGDFPPIAVTQPPPPSSPYVTYTQDTISYLGDIFSEVSDQYLFATLSDPLFKGPLLSDELFIEIELKSEEAQQQSSLSSSTRSKSHADNGASDNIIAQGSRPRSSSEIKLSQHLRNLIFDRTNDILASIHSLRHFGTCADNSFLSHVPLAQRFLAQNIPLKSSVLAEFVKKQLMQEHMIYLKEECIYDTPADVVDVRLLDSFADEVLKEENKDIDRITDIILANCLLDTSTQLQHVFR